MSVVFATKLEDYAEKFADYIQFRREDGILEARLHTNGGPMIWGPEEHHVMIPAAQYINADPENEALIITGTGEYFLRDFPAGINERKLETRGLDGHMAFDLFYEDQTRLPLHLLDLRMPVIGAINGPIHFHPELALLSDLVICSDNTYFYENHWDNVGIVPGDGVHILYRELLGHIRGKYFMLTGEKIHAAEAKELGLVSEVLAPEDLLPRAWELARSVFMTKNRYHRRLARSLLTQPWRELFTKELFSGMAHEGFGCALHWPRADETKRGEY
jgi:enoyl-CoA hydratase/carnithine racemase